MFDTGKDFFSQASLCRTCHEHHDVGAPSHQATAGAARVLGILHHSSCGEDIGVRGHWYRGHGECGEY